MRIICAVGNTMRRDDGVGIRVGELLRESFEVIFCYTYPERFLEEICSKKPREVIVVDGGELGLSPGQFREVAPEEIDSHTVSTHTLPLSLFSALLKECCPKVRFMVIQVKDLSFGEGLSPEVEEGAKKLAKFLKGMAT